MRLAGFVVAGLVLGVSASVQAASIVETASYGPANLPAATSTTLNIAQFDASLGTLTGIKVELIGTSDGTLSVRRGNNGALVSVTYSTTMGVDYDLSLNSTSLFVVDVDSAVSVTVPRNRTVVGTATSGSGSDSVTFNDAGSLALFTGLGVVTFDLGLTPENVLPPSMSPINQNPSNGNMGTQTYTFANTAGAELLVTYTYVGIPEPLTLSLFGLSLVGLGVVRQIKRRS